MQQDQVKVCDRVAEQMVAMNYVVMTRFNEHTEQLEYWVMENQYNSFKASFQSS